ncbi:hypothetical protein E1B28_008991 [Marasmius oreades]|uniref:Elongin-A n=1 Tax=Marasmius oreades TaxID=181124 RepID=A0A9P7RZK1_9AGAR|nr:uncharacterized protein E1B28_008991 [Marasmius oreades]KAG7092654.1 hypothetical protein E1B28_008991 [Marasmius oreades]
MVSGGDSLNRGVLSLVQCCQRVAAKHADSISSLGDMSYDLVKPILEGCSAETLLRLEKASPHFQEETQEIWRNICFRSYSKATERYREGESSSPKCWRNYYFVLVKEEKERLEAVGSKIRTQRLEAAENKKGREVKFIERAPPQKRSRWNTIQPPKTLFQKTRSEASKLQRNIYSARMIPPMPKGRDYRPTTDAGDLLPKPPTSYTSRVTVNIVRRQQPLSTAMSTASHLSCPPSAQAKSKELSITPTSPPIIASSVLTNDYRLGYTQNKNPPPSSNTHTQSPSLPKQPAPVKKDLMATLFVPKHKAYSQRTK